MEAVNRLELEILISFIHYPNHLVEFLDKVQLKIFSKEAQRAITIINDLCQKNALGLNAFFEHLSNKERESEYFQELLLCAPSPNYLSLIEIFKHTYQIKAQERIGKTLLEASNNNTLLDLMVLQKDLDVETKEFKTLEVWVEEYAKKPKAQTYKTGIPFVDNCFGGGFELGQLMLIFGEPEAGKTMFSLQILENLSKYTKVCFFCFEFTIDDYLKRRGNCSFVQSDNFFIINDGYDINEIAQNIKSLYKKGVRFFLIDSQMRVTNTGRNSEEEESVKFSTLAKLCHSLNIFVIFICQNSKTDKDNPLGTKKGGHEASIIIHIERVKPKSDDLEQKGSEYDENARIFKVKKNKQTGKHYKDRILFDKSKLRFYEDNAKQKDIEIIYEQVQKELEMPVI
ncbi:RAD55 family ATPase [Helicobacter sp.]|uniref:RAD55 family ATPase n=1 Tax=Helicobacter sp. TaxID=218 RepID=UPI002A7500FA|nr:ATPase domain-containing protein [Helicobacter sp.]MDY2584073.1 ATPase domain-containing protein [Helicobacter sp.]